MVCPVCNAKLPDGSVMCRTCGAKLSQEGPMPELTLAPGTRLRGGDFTVGKVLGQGGFGITYQGSEVALRRTVAIKEFFPQGCLRQGTTVVPSSPTDFASAKHRFLEEARNLAQFQHPNIVDVFGCFEENNTAYMVMELVRGQTLLSLVEQSGSLPEWQVLDFAKQIGAGLSVIHRENFLHRDIKPENVIVTDDGRAVLVDFGSARAFAVGRTRQMTAMVTPGYAPLEQYGTQARFGVYTDIYALGATLYHLLTGRQPIPATDRAAGVDLLPPNRINKNVRQNVSDAVMWALETKADRRPQSVEEFLKALERGIASSRAPQPRKDAQATEQSPPIPRTNPYEAAILRISDKLVQPSDPPPPFLEAARIAEIKKFLAALEPLEDERTWSQCPSCMKARMKWVEGKVTRLCPICKRVELLAHRLDEEKCPICREGRLVQQELDRSQLFCPVCHLGPLKEERRKRFGVAVDLWYVCPDCKAELDVKTGGKAELVRYEVDPYGVGNQYRGQVLSLSEWRQLVPRSNAFCVCDTCGASFDLPGTQLMTLVHYASDPHNIAFQYKGVTLGRSAWAKVAAGLQITEGNVYCPNCKATFDYDKKRSTMRLLECPRGSEATRMYCVGKELSLREWACVAAGKRSPSPGWLCPSCGTEFNSVTNGLMLVHSTARPLTKAVGKIYALVDWQRMARELPTRAVEKQLRAELVDLEARERAAAEQWKADQDKQRERLFEEYSKLLHQCFVEGFASPMPHDKALSLRSDEMCLWTGHAVRWRYCRRGEWALYSEGTLSITEKRVIFRSQEATRWERSITKIIEVEATTLQGTKENFPFLVMVLSDLVNPVGFTVEPVEVTIEVAGRKLPVGVGAVELAKLLRRLAEPWLGESTPPDELNIEPEKWPVGERNRLSDETCLWRGRAVRWIWTKDKWAVHGEGTLTITQDMIRFESWERSLADIIDIDRVTLYETRGAFPFIVISFINPSNLFGFTFHSTTLATRDIDALFTLLQQLTNTS